MIGNQALVFVVDCSNYKRIAEAGLELARIIQHSDTRDAALLVFANKQDIEGGMRAFL